MDNDNKPKNRSFFRRSSDAESRPENETTERGEQEFAPREERESFYERDRERPARRPREDRPPGERGSFARRGAPGKPFDKKPGGKRPARPADPEKLPDNVIFGIHPVKEAIEAGTEIEKIYLRRAGADLSQEERTQSKALNVLHQQILDAGIHIQEVPVEKLNRLSRNHNHQGVVAVTSAISYKELNELVEELETLVTEGENPLVMVLDSVTDIRNFGAIARSAECAGVHALIIPAKNSAPVNAEAIKSSAGALTLIPVCRAGSLKGAVNLLKSIGIRCVAATEKSDTLIYEADMTGPTAIVMGSEDKGISRDVLSLCDVQAGIPLFGRIESLNVSAASAVALFEARRQRFERS